ncbi:MAG: hypothetical protein GWP38_10245 [Planctomycetia bacterium]|nr:hypothetical protein [Planctomycetia bacterium]
MSDPHKDDRLIVPSSTILILFLTLAIVTPLASYRMAQNLVTPAVEELEVEQPAKGLIRKWTSNQYTYTLEQYPSDLERAGQQDLKLTFESGGTAISKGKSGNFKIRDVLFLDPDGDGCHTIIVWGQVDEKGALHKILGSSMKFSEDGVSSEGSTFDLTPIPNYLSEGYGGQDVIERQSELLVRRFPVLKDTDVEFPTGLERSMIWDFKKSMWRKDPRSER